MKWGGCTWLQWQSWFSTKIVGWYDFYAYIGELTKNKKEERKQADGLQYPNQGQNKEPDSCTGKNNNKTLPHTIHTKLEVLHRSIQEIKNNASARSKQETFFITLEQAKIS